MKAAGKSESIFTMLSRELKSDSDPALPISGFKTVLLTGGAGFIGSHVAEFLLARGDRVVIVDEMNDYYDVNLKMANLDLLRTSYGDLKRGEEPMLSIYRGDICDVDFISDVFEKERPTHICHLAARAGVRPR